MGTQLLEIKPRELKFTFEVKKQSSCVVYLANSSDQFVAFKVKATSPKKYCVRPNIGIVKPKSTCDFTVTMHAQKSAPSDMQCKDKFLIQSYAVPYGTTEENITPETFVKDSGKYIEENKIRVVLISPTHSPVLLPINADSKQEQSHDFSLGEDAGDVRNATEEPARPVKVLGNMESSTSKEVEPRLVKDVEGVKFTLTRDIEGLKSRQNVLDSNLIEAESTIARLKEEKSVVILEKQKLNQELAMSRRKSDQRQIRVGFPVLFVCMVALVGLAVGYLLHP